MVTLERQLIVVCPVGRGVASSLHSLVARWEAALDENLTDWEWLFIDDGAATPATRRALKEIVTTRPRFKLWRAPSQWRARAAVFGCRMVQPLTNWILQVDSAGQCRAQDFANLWKARMRGSHQFGIRATRDDGRVRSLVSIGKSLSLWVSTGIWHPDPDCPFRLLYAPKIAGLLEAYPLNPMDASFALRLYDESRFSRIGFSLGHRDGREPGLLGSLYGMLQRLFSAPLQH